VIGIKVTSKIAVVDEQTPISYATQKGFSAEMETKLFKLTNEAAQLAYQSNSNNFKSLVPKSHPLLALLSLMSRIDPGKA
jgi:hypothetical protein